jgi:hypothetical protein
MILYIKNMVCSRCKMVVKDELIKLGIHPQYIDLGEVEITEELDTPRKTRLNVALQLLGFELIDDKKSQLIEKIKKIIIELVHHSEDHLQTNFSEHLSKNLYHDYNY